MYWWRGDHQAYKINSPILFKAKKTAFKSGDKDTYNTARAKVKAGIKEGKMRHQQRQDRDLNQNSSIFKMSQQWPYHVWGHVVGYAEHMLCFDLLEKESALNSTPLPEDWPL